MGFFFYIYIRGGGGGGGDLAAQVDLTLAVLWRLKTSLCWDDGKAPWNQGFSEDRQTVYQLAYIPGRSYFMISAGCPSLKAVLEVEGRGW